MTDAEGRSNPEVAAMLAGAQTYFPFLRRAQDLELVFGIGEDLFATILRELGPGISDRCALLFLTYCRDYPTRRRLGITFDVSASTATSEITRFLEAMEGHFPLDWNRRREAGSCGGMLASCWSLIDSTSFRIEKPGRDQALFFSGHHHTHEMKYEVVTNLAGRVVYLSPPFAGSSHDMAIYRATQEQVCCVRVFPSPLTTGGVQLVLAPGELMLGDRAYLGAAAAAKVACGYREPVTREERRLNEEIVRQRILIENTFGRIKSKWRILRDRWRHSLGRLHPRVLRTLIKIHNLDLDLHPMRAAAPPRVLAEEEDADEAEEVEMRPAFYVADDELFFEEDPE
ncbi:hypothetical protein PAPYR_11126 [Paratrimastix pyriformis]|uniref:DDE Tnp4 domain-containing protein n=1 Tax=Paratrimastix pyriformis TaxID=342808 RepID=A0ABQ8U4G6_9EUKA|nr:hypothetical protein PAPYR_11126 [Paratrimastix pyriformis]